MKVWELCCFKETKLSFSKAWCDRPIHLNCMEPVLLLKSWDLGCVGCIVHIWVCISPSCKLLCQVRTLLGALQKQWLMFCLKGSTSISDQLLPFLLALWCQVCPQHVWRAGWSSTTYLHKLVLTVAAYDKFCRTWDTCWLVNVVNSGCVFLPSLLFAHFLLLFSLLSGFSFTCGSVDETELLPGQAWVQVFIPMYRWKSQLMDPDLELASCRSVTCLRLWLVRAHSLLFFLSNIFFAEMTIFWVVRDQKDHLVQH